MKHVAKTLAFRNSLLVFLTLAGYAIAGTLPPNKLIDEETSVNAKTYREFHSTVQDGKLVEYEPQSAPCYGEWMFPIGKSRNLNDYQAVFVGGLWDPRKPFQNFVNKWGMPGFYIVPARSKFGDLLRLGRIKLIGRSDPFAKDLAESMRHVHRKMTIYGISQGALAIVNAIKHHGMSNQHTFVFFSPALSYGAIRRNIPADNFEFLVPWFDASSVWAPSRNPLRILAGMTDLACGACMHWRKPINYHFLLYQMRKQYPDEVVRYTTIRNEKGERRRTIIVHKRKSPR